jgi:hypothetical protein
MNTGYDLTGNRPRPFQGKDRQKEADMNREITIRPSTKADLPEIAQLAALDSRHSPAGDALLAFVDHELRAAVDLDSGDAVADPFHHTADLVELLRLRANGLEQTSGFGWRAFRHAAQAA